MADAKHKSPELKLEGVQYLYLVPRGRKRLFGVGRFVEEHDFSRAAKACL